MKINRIVTAINNKKILASPSLFFTHIHKVGINPGIAPPVEAYCFAPYLEKRGESAIKEWRFEPGPLEMEIRRVSFLLFVCFSFSLKTPALRGNRRRSSNESSSPVYARREFQTLHELLCFIAPPPHRSNTCKFRNSNHPLSHTLKALLLDFELPRVHPAFGIFFRNAEIYVEVHHSVWLK